MTNRRPLVIGATGDIAELARIDSLDAALSDPLVLLVARLATAVKFLGVDPTDLPPDPEVLDSLT